jgi:hypothetical protein
VNDDTDPFIFPDMPDEAVAAIDQFLEAFNRRFQNHYFAQMHRTTHSMSTRAIAVPHQTYRSKIRRSEAGGNDRGESAAVTIADGPSPIVITGPSN